MGIELSDTRRRVAKEAARLLYTGAAEEYKQAKKEAARNLGVDVMPSNFEVAVELDLIAEDMEGEERRFLLIEKREAALDVMMALKYFEPRLVGSVWRGTSRRGSDIDVSVYASQPDSVVSKLIASGFNVECLEEITVSKGGMQIRSHHIHVGIDGNLAEVVVRPLTERDKNDKCDIYGDLKRGLTLKELENIMEKDPLRKFVPKRRYR